MIHCICDLKTDVMDLLEEAAVLHIGVLQQEMFLQQKQHDAERPQRRRRWRPKRFWVRTWLTNERRLQYEHYDQLMHELRMEDITCFFNYLRMEPHMMTFSTELAPESISEKPTSGQPLNLGSS